MLRKVSPATADRVLNAHRMVGMRNVLDPRLRASQHQTVWACNTTDVPRSQRLQVLLNEHDPPGAPTWVDACVLLTPPTPR